MECDKILLAAILVLTGVGPQSTVAQSSEELKPGALFKGTGLPSPPKQGAPWKPPAGKLPEKFAGAVEELLKQGIADPRGCEYREVELSCGASAWAAGCWLVKTRAWVIPRGQSDNENASRFAVTWDGLVYPLAALGPAVGLETDVDASIAADDKWWKGEVEEQQKQSKADPQSAWAFSPNRWEGHAAAESHLVSGSSPRPLQACMLCILGEGKLAERVWNAWKRGTTFEAERGAATGDPYLLFAHAWAWALFDRAVGAHKRGDDVIAMLDARRLVELEKAADPIAEKRGFARPFDPGPKNRKMPYFDFGGSPARLLEDSERRVKQGPVKRVLDTGVNKFPNKSKRIAALIRDLEEASAEQWSQPGGVSISDSAIVQALVKEGEPAVEPLLDCLAKDRRLTRAVGFHRDFFESRYFIPVASAVYAALRGILHVDSFGPLTEYGFDGDRQSEVAGEVRGYWKKHKGLSKEEGWLAVLSDDNATSKQLLDAAQRIVELQPANDPAARQGSVVVNGRLVVVPEDGWARPLAGDSLRGKKDPSVTDLIIERGDETAGRARLQDSFFEEQTACELTVCLAKWDLKAAVPSIRRRIKESRHFTAQTPLTGNQGLGSLAGTLGLLFEAGIQAGDDGIAEDYADCMRSMPEKPLEHIHDRGIFIPLFRHADNPKLAELARWMFDSDESVWRPVHNLGFSSEELIASPLVSAPAFRELLKRELANRSSIGTVHLDRGGGRLEVENASIGYGSEYAPDVDLPQSEQQGPLRSCDFYALQITRLEGAPRFELYWPEMRRDEAIKEISVYIVRWGNAFRDRRKVLDAGYLWPDRPKFYMPRLTQPATAADVAAGRAIFALRDRPNAQVRVVELKPYPAVGRWKTLKQFRLARPFPVVPPGTKEPSDPKAYAKFPQEGYDREGYLWQAEEVLVDGKWRRYYGFVGRHIIAKAPAEEIEPLDHFTDPMREWR